MDDKTIVRLLAEKVMDFVVGSSGEYWVADSGNGHVYRIDLWNPLTNDADACMVLDKMTDDGWEWAMWSAGGYTVEFGGGGTSDGSPGENAIVVQGSNSDSRRRAICIAALKAVGVWEDQPETNAATA